MPLLLVGVFLGLLEFFGVMAIFEQIVEPYTMGLLGLPGYSATRVFGIRKEMAFETLAMLAGTQISGGAHVPPKLRLLRRDRPLHPLPCDHNGPPA